MLQQNVKTTTLLTFPYSAQTRIVVKARMRMKSHVNTRSGTAESHTSNCEEIREIDDVLDDYDGPAADYTCAILST